MFAAKLLPVAAAAGAFAAVSGAGYIITSQPKWAKLPDGMEDVQMLERVPSRAQQVSKLRGSTREHPFDLLIIGGGATGTGCAVDAVTRGLRTALVEREDFGSGTSSKSTKLVHGGVRYLEKAVFQLDWRQLKLVFEALHERATLLANAPHLAQPLPILTPCYKWWEVPYYWAGLKAYDLVAGRTNLVLSKYVSPAETVGLLPTLALQQPGPEGSSLKGSILYYDGQFDDARLNVALACTAAAAGSVVANYVEVKKLIKNEDGKVVGATVQDRVSPEPPFDVYARVVINSTGCFSDEVRHLSRPAAEDMIMPSSGSHITLPGFYGGSSRNGMIIPKTKDGRVVFMLPWQDHVIAGTTDAKCGVTARPRASKEEVEFILDALSEFLGIKVRSSDVLSTWSGIRPLAVDPRAKDTQNTVRDHVVVEEADGLVTVTGGKWTTYRLMAQEAIDAVVATGRMPVNVRPCRTETVKVVGGAKYTPTLFATLAQEYGPPTHQGSGPGHGPKRPVVDARVAQHLALAYGDRAGRVLQLAEDRGLHKPLVAGHPYLEAEVLYGMLHEYCETAEDFLARRTRLAFLDVGAALQALPRVVELMAAEGRWDQQRRYRELANARDFLATFLPPVPAATVAAPAV